MDEPNEPKREKQCFFFPLEKWCNTEGRGSAYRQRLGDVGVSQCTCYSGLVYFIVLIWQVKFSPSSLKPLRLAFSPRVTPIAVERATDKPEILDYSLFSFSFLLSQWVFGFGRSKEAGEIKKNSENGTKQKDETMDLRERDRERNRCWQRGRKEKLT